MRKIAGSVDLRLEQHLWPILKLRGINGEWVEVHLHREDLHDLQYCIGRVLAEGKDEF